MDRPEERLQIQVCEYLKIQYPHVIFFSEPSGLRVGMGQAIKLKKMRSAGKLPDLFIAYPNGKYHGFFIELKKEGTTIFKKDGTIVKDEHIQKQFDTLMRLHKLGYAACFGVGFDDVLSKITRYFKLEQVGPQRLP